MSSNISSSYVPYKGADAASGEDAQKAEKALEKSGRYSKMESNGKKVGMIAAIVALIVISPLTLFLSLIPACYLIGKLGGKKKVVLHNHANTPSKVVVMPQPTPISPVVIRPAPTRGVPVVVTTTPQQDRVKVIHKEKPGKGILKQKKNGNVVYKEKPKVSVTTINDGGNRIKFKKKDEGKKHVVFNNKAHINSQSWSLGHNDRPKPGKKGHIQVGRTGHVTVKQPGR